MDTIQRKRKKPLVTMLVHGLRGTVFPLCINLIYLDYNLTCSSTSACCMATVTATAIFNHIKTGKSKKDMTQTVYIFFDHL